VGFYIVVHIVLGFLAVNAADLQKLSRTYPSKCPSWVQDTWGQLGSVIMSLFAFAAIITSFFQWGLIYALFTFGELLLGGVFVKLFPLGIRFILALIGPFIAFIIMGNLWGFWYI
jgi:hypothetical protein